MLGQITHPRLQASFYRFIKQITLSAIFINLSRPFAEELVRDDCVDLRVDLAVDAVVTDCLQRVEDDLLVLDWDVRVAAQNK
jgi:hypothetical protein